jgi:LacI family transcriptional regulator
MKSTNNVTLADIAQQLDVSIVSVSKALAHKKGVSNMLSRKINQLAKEMGYRQKVHVFDNEKKTTTGNIGILVPARFFSVNTSFYWTLYSALSRELMRSGYYCILEQLSETDEFDLSLPHMIRDKKVDGIIVLGQLSMDYVYYFIKQYFHFIFLDFYINDEQIDTVTTDNFYSEYMITTYLISQGHKDIRFVGTFRATTSIADRCMGFMKAMLENGLPAPPSGIINDRDSHGHICITLPDKMPTAFVCNCDDTAVELINELRKQNLNVPGDISVVGFDNYVRDNAFRPTLTTIEVPQSVTARLASDLIIKKITGNAYTPGNHVVSGRLILRDSVKKIN